MFILVTGGSGSGKSEYAENRVLSLNNPRRVYLATMMCFDDEGKKRIKRHQNMRAGKGFRTVECFYGLDQKDVCSHGETVLLECMSNLTANEYFSPDGAGENTVTAIETGIDRLLRTCDNLVVVSNEVFSDGNQYDPSTERYLNMLGQINTWMAARADEVVEVVFGIPCIIKGRTLT